MSTPDKPAPQYGEYASDEEIAAAIKKSGGTASADAERSVTKAVAAPGAATVPQSLQPARPRNAADRIATVFLLAFGFVYVLGGISTYLNLGQTLTDTMKRFGMGAYEPTSQTAGIGIAMIVSQVVCWVLAAVWSYRRLSQRKISWWAPVVLGIVSFLILTVLLGSLLAADPSFLPKL